MEYGILKINTTQNSSNGISNEITELNLMFFNSTLVLINQFAHKGVFCRSYPDASALVTQEMRATIFISFIIPNRLNIPLPTIFWLSLARIVKRLTELRCEQARLAIAHARAVELHKTEPEYGSNGLP